MIRKGDSHLIIRFTQSSETGSVQLTLTIHFKSGLNLGALFSLFGFLLF